MQVFDLLNDRRLLLGGLALLCLASGALALYTTSQGPVGFSDSAGYLGAGRNWARGAGLGVYQASGDFEPLIVQPPLYPAYFAGLHHAGIDLVEGGRRLGVAAAVLAPLALGLIFLRHSRTPSLGLLATFFYIIFPPLALANASLLTDAIFLAILLWGSLALLEYQRTASRAWWGLAIALFGMLPLIRYVGAALVAAGALYLMVWSPSGKRWSWWAGLLFGALASLPLLLWQAWSYASLDPAVAGRQTNFSIYDLLPALTEFLARSLSVLSGWLPVDLWREASNPWPLFLALAVLGLLVSRWVARQEAGSVEGDERAVFAVFALCALFFFSSVSAAYVFTRPTPDINDRTLLPLFVCALGAGLAAVGVLAERRPGWSARFAVLAAAIAVALYAPATYPLSAALHRGQVGYFTQAWRNSALVEEVRQLPPAAVVIASEPGLLLYWADRPAYHISPGLTSAFLESGRQYGQDEQDGAQRIFSTADQALLVLFNEFPQGLHTDLRRSGALQGLPVLIETPQGTIYGQPGASP